MSRAWRSRLSRLGFGVSGAHGTPLLSRAKTLDLIEQAHSLGITAFDTAPAYGAGEAERRLGAALKRIGRDQVLVSTKAGLTSYGLAGRRRDFSPDGIEAGVRASLKRLDIDGADLVFLHGPDPRELTPQLFTVLDDLKRAGAFAALGVAGRGAELDAALETGRFEALMAPGHPFLDSTERHRLEAAAEAGVAVFAIETAGDQPAPLRAPRSPADLYKLARAARPQPSGRGRVSAVEGLRRACGWTAVACAMMTTTRSDHLRDGAALSGVASERY